MSCLMNIRKQFDEVIDYSQGFYPKQSKKIIKQWFRAKKDFIRNLGGFIYEYPEEITVELSDQEKQNKLNDFIDWVERRYGLFGLSKFISDNKDGFFKNEVLKNYNLEHIVVPKGMKMLKAFKYFEENKEILTDIQNRASMIIQENKITGTLCLSVHPLDYLSSSENTHNWRSCHALDGEYRAGNLSYMLDSSTIVCYLKSKENVKLPRFPESVPWNNKKWRCLLFISEDKRMMFAGRPYPFAATGLLDKIREIVDLKKILIKNPGGFWKFEQVISPWFNTYFNKMNYPGYEEGFILNDRFILGKDNCLVGMYDLIEDASNSMHYNDLLKSSCYVPYYAWVGYDSLWSDFIYPEFRSHFTIGSTTYCLNCGRHIVKEPDTFLCEDCSDIRYDEDRLLYCECCGESINEDDAIFLSDNSIVCRRCADNNCEQCVDCGDIFYQDEMEAIRDDDNRHVSWICKDCLEERRES